MDVKTNEPLTIGLDIGIASVGWAVLAPNRIVALGVRAFDKAETAKEGESLNFARRTARLMRRRLRRRAWRLTKLARSLKREGLIASVEVLKSPPAKGTPAVNPWQLRAEALDRKLEAEEWARVLYHLCKHRGFHWLSRAEEKKADEDKEGGAVKKGLAGTKKLMQEKNYRTTAEMVLAEYPEAHRNKQGDYSKALSRSLLCEELTLLFKRQRELGNSHANKELETAILGNGDKKSGVFWEQKPALSGKALLAMLGHCTFEKAEYRAPKASYTAERHVWLTRLNNLRIVVDGATRPLTEEERRIALPLPYQSGEKFTYKHLRTALVKAGLTDSFRFAGLSYPSERQKVENKAKDPEADSLVKLPAWHELRLTLKKKGLEDEWQRISVAALEGNPEILDQIAWVLSIYKEDDEVTTELNKLTLPNAEKMLDALLDIRFDKFHALSLKALHRIVPHMESGLRYDEACEKAGYHHSQIHKVSEDEHQYLPPLYAGRDKDGRMVFSKDLEVPRNPVVLRALNQARKVVNAIIREYGSPHAVHIEMARDLSRPLTGHWTDQGKYIEGRRDIQKKQEQYRDDNEKDKAEFADQFCISGNPKGSDFEKWRLYREQQGKCAYSVEAIDINRLLEPGYVEVDHALPYSRSFDDSKNNKVLVFAKENRDKGNRTPYEYLGGVENSPRWRQFVAFVESSKAYRLAKRGRLLRKDFGEKESREFRERNLNDTRYICRFMKNYVEQYLQLADDSEIKRCVVVSGQLTSLLRARWGLVKMRSDSDRHHALDAAVVAACSHGMVKRMSDYARRKELDQVREGFVDMETGEVVNPAMYQQLQQHFPDPWPHFRSELEARLKIDELEKLRTAMQQLGTYPPDALNILQPLFVSRAPQRRNSGAAHKETVYARPRDGHVLMLEDKEAKKVASDSDKKILRRATDEEKVGLAVERIGVMDKDNKGNYKLSSENLDYIIDPYRNKKMVEALRQWIAGRDEREKTAKAIEVSFGRGKEKRAPTDAEDAELKWLRSLPRKPLKSDPDNGPFTGPIIRAVKVNAGRTTGISVRNGIATNDTMLRVDLFAKAGKYFLVPVYVHHSVVKELPNRAIVAHKDEKDWTVINDSFDFRFSMYPNDLIRITQNQGVFMGYYAGCDRGSGNVNLWAHDRNQKVGKDGLIRGIGVKTALNVEKFNVDVLGNTYPSLPEKRRDLA